MDHSQKKNKQKRQIQERERAEIEPPDQEILDSIVSPNVWTPESEDVWLEELRKITAGEIYRRFPPMKKAPSVKKRGKGSGWGDM